MENSEGDSISLRHVMLKSKSQAGLRNEHKYRFQSFHLTIDKVPLKRFLVCFFNDEEQFAGICLR